MTNHDYDGPERRSDNIQMRLDVAEIHETVASRMATRHEGIVAMLGLNVPARVIIRTMELTE